MAETEVVSPPPLRTPATESDSLAGREDAPAERRDGKPERSRRDEDIPDMTVEEAHKALNALPKPEPQPDTEEHDAKVAAINDDIKKIKDEIEVIRVKIDEAQEARRGQGDEMDEARSVMRSLKEERDEIRSQLSTIQEESVRAKAALEGHDKTKRQLQAHLKFRTVPEIEEAIRKMEIRQQTSSMSLAEEKKLVKEIEQLKQSKKTAAQYVTQEEAVGKAKDGYGAARKTESEKKAELRAVSEKLKAAHTALEEMNKTRDEEGGEVSALYEERKAKQEMIKEKIEEIKELRGAHRAKLDNWKRLLRRKTELLPMTKSLRALASKIQLWAGTKGFAESNQLHMLDAVQLIYLAWGDVTQKTIARHNQRRERSKLRRALGKAEYLSRQEAKNARAKALEEEEAKKIPYESEMVLCDTLVAYLETTFLRSEAPSVPKTNGAVELSKNIAFTEFDGKKMVMKKRSDEEYIVGAGKKRGGARRKGGGKGNAGGQKGSKGSAIVHAIDTMESFSLLSIPPPPNRAAVPDAIKALKEKRTWYSEQPRGTIPSKNKGDKPKPAGSKKEIAPEITDEAFPSLPGTLNPKPLAVAEALNGDLEASKPAGEDGDAGDEASPKSEENGEGEKETAEEEANGEEDAADTGEGLSKGVEKEQVEPAVTAASIVANGVNGSASKGKINEAPASPEATEAAAEGEGEGAGAGAEVSGVKDEEEGEGEGGDGEDGAGATAEEGGEEGEEEERGEPECDAEPAAEGTENGDAGDATGEDDGAEDVEVKKSEEVQVVDGEGAANEDGDDGEETNDTPPPSIAPVAEPLEAAKPSSSAEKDQEGGEECGANDAASKDVEEEG